MSLDKLNRRRFPLVKKLSGLHFDIVALQNELEKFESSFIDVKQSNQHLCLNNPDLTDRVYSHYEQVNLTVFNEEKFKNFRHTDTYKQLLSKKFFKDPKMDEYFYDLPSEEFRTSYFKKVLDQIPGNTIRARLVKLKAGKNVPFHVDYDVRYATRLIIPLVTNSSVKNYFIKDGQEFSFHIPADGGVYFLNVGYSHAVSNHGNSDRVILMFSKDQFNFLGERADEFLLAPP